MKTWIKAGLAALTVLAIGVSAQSFVPHPPKPAFPQLQLPEKARGQRAIDLLAGRLPEVAAWYGKSPAEFAAILRRDRLAWIDRNGRLYYEEELDQPLPTLTPSGDTYTSTGEFAPLDQTFKLHSRPGAKRTIFVNFLGATLTNTVWNNSSGQSTINAAPFDLDGMPSSFSSTELQRVQAIWQRVAEDFAPFDVNVTTEPPPADAITRSGSGDDVFGTMVLVTRRTFYSCSCGGVAYVGAFDDTTNYYKPALVFFDALGGNEKNIAEAISHEAGHNLGLHHDGTSSSGYYTGHGDGATGWAPIMGVGYYKSLVQWSKGEYPDANNKEDDYAVMAANGLPVRPDDHGNTTSTASRLGGTVSGGLANLVGRGVISTPTDVDVFSFTAAAGAATINVTPAARSGNVDLRVELLNGNGAVIAAANPVDALNASISTTLAAGGTYYVSVRGTGNSGYTSYGSVGEYRIAATVPASATQPPVAVLSAAPTSGTAPLVVSFSASGSYDPDGTIASIEWNFGDGATAQGVNVSRTYSNVGTYTATLKVTDNAGLTDVRTVTINASAPVVITSMSVASVTVTVNQLKGGQAEGIAQITVRDRNGQPVAGATVSGTWSGVVNNSASGVTNTSGVATVKSQKSKSSGQFTYTVNNVTRDGYQYTPSSVVSATAVR